MSGRVVDREKANASVRRWYHANKGEYNAARREAYAADKASRDKARERARRYRSALKSGGKITRKIYVTLDDGSRVLAFSTGQVAHMLGRTPQMIRNWERRGWIPVQTHVGAHRVYLKHQFQLIRELDTLVRLTEDVPRVEREGFIAKKVDHILDNW